MDLQRRREELTRQLQQTAIQLEQLKGALAIIDELMQEQVPLNDRGSSNGESPG